MIQFSFRRFLRWADFVSSAGDPREGSCFPLLWSVGFPVSMDAVARGFSVGACLRLSFFFSLRECVRGRSLFVSLGFMSEFDVGMGVG